MLRCVCYIHLHGLLRVGLTHPMVLKTYPYKDWYVIRLLSLAAQFLTYLAIDKVVWKTCLFGQIVKRTHFALLRKIMILGNAEYWLPVLWQHSHHSTSKMICSRQDLGEDPRHGWPDNYQSEVGGCMILLWMLLLLLLLQRPQEEGGKEKQAMPASLPCPKLSFPSSL